MRKVLRYAQDDGILHAEVLSLRKTQDHGILHLTRRILSPSSHQARGADSN